MPEYKCEPCGFTCKTPTNLKKHQLSDKHCRNTGKVLSDEEKQMKKKIRDTNKRLCKEYHKKNGEDMKRKNNERYYKNREIVLKQQREYYNKNKVAINAKRKVLAKKSWWVPIISASKFNDKKYNRYTDEVKLNFIDKEFLLEQYALQENKCIYCDNVMSKREGARQKSRLSIERIDNCIGHTKDNCVFSCWGCNLSRKDRYTHEEQKERTKEHKEFVLNNYY